MTTPQSLAPGWCRAPVRTLDLDTLDSPPPRFPPHTRAGFLESTLTPPNNPPPTNAPFIALTTTLDPPQLLALCHRGACGLILTDPTPPPRHTQVLARALGIPMASFSGLTAPPTHLTLDTTGPTPLTNPDALLLDTTGFTRVLPTPMLPEQATDPLPWLELACGQAEERWLATEALDQGRAAGVGLLRLEFVFYSDPGLDEEGLTDFLTGLLADLSPAPVALRLADWASDKPPNNNTPLQAWNGAPGLAGLMHTGALEAQIRALSLAAEAAKHPEVWCVAPHAEDPIALRHTRGLLKNTGLHLGAMLESPNACSALTTFRSIIDGVWVGLGDLSRSSRGHEQVRDALDMVRQSHLSAPVFVCGPLSDRRAPPLLETAR